MELAESIYSELTRARYEVLYDDRDERAGVKFADADLLGMPLRITIGKLASERLAECKTRRDSAAELVAADRLLEYANQTLRGGKTV
jgi:prolyl-tRNA synthetase